MTQHFNLALFVLKQCCESVGLACIWHVFKSHSYGASAGVWSYLPLDSMTIPKRWNTFLCKWVNYGYGQCSSFMEESSMSVYSWNTLLKVFLLQGHHPGFHLNYFGLCQYGRLWSKFSKAKSKLSWDGIHHQISSLNFAISLYLKVHIN